MTKAFEIERKFLVLGDEWRKAAFDISVIEQHYLISSPMTTVRIRRKDDQFFFTIKEQIEGCEGVLEIEDLISAYTFDALKSLSKSSIEKNRHYFRSEDGMLWEIDVFKGRLFGLVIAEVELESMDQSIIIPDFIGNEVTHDPAYSNAVLSEKR